MSKRRYYKIRTIYINLRFIDSVVIDDHYESKHSSYMNDDLILKLVHMLKWKVEVPEIRKGSYLYFSTLLYLSKKQYRLIWLLEDYGTYIGIINAYRDNRKVK